MKAVKYASTKAYWATQSNFVRKIHNPKSQEQVSVNAVSSMVNMMYTSTLKNECQRNR